MRACRRQDTAYTPVWLMRQAGRYLPEYRRIREHVAFLELCRDSELAAQVTVDTVHRLGVDAAIIFADILLPLDAMGMGLRFDPGDGPQLERPIRTLADVEGLHTAEVAESLGFVGTTIRLTKRALADKAPVIGFAGAPFTVASYAIEGGSSRNFILTKTLMYREPATWDALMERICTVTHAYLEMQIEAGADALQLFDSWVGCLSPDDYERFVLPHVRRLIEAISGRVPIIYFGTMTGALLERMRAAGPDVVGIDWRVNLSEAWNRVGHNVALQGNLDPVALFADRGNVRESVRAILAQAGGRPGHIFNLGHGVLPGTPVDNVLELVDAVHELSAR